MVTTKFYAPASAPVAGGERVNLAPEKVTESWGVLRALTADAALSALGQGSHDFHWWRGPVFQGQQPEPGWEIEVAGRRYRVLSAAKMLGKVWRLDVERIR